MRLSRERTATPNELQDIIARAREFKLTDGERNQLGVDLSIVIAQRAQRGNGRQEDPSAEFITKVLGMLQTPYGLVERGWIQEQLRSGAQAIAKCRNHRPPSGRSGEHCACWAEQRGALWQIQSTYPFKSPESWAAGRTYDSLAELETSSRPERGRGTDQGQ